MQLTYNKPLKTIVISVNINIKDSQQNKCCTQGLSHLEQNDDNHGSRVALKVISQSKTAISATTSMFLESLRQHRDHNWDHISCNMNVLWHYI